MIGSIQGTCVSYVSTSLGESEYHSCAVRIGKIGEDKDGDGVSLGSRVVGLELQAVNPWRERAVDDAVEATLRIGDDFARLRQLPKYAQRV